MPFLKIVVIKVRVVSLTVMGVEELVGIQGDDDLYRVARTGVDRDQSLRHVKSRD